MFKNKFKIEKKKYTKENSYDARNKYKFEAKFTIKLDNDEINEYLEGLGYDFNSDSKKSKGKES